jgi:hypothetical protein
MTHQVVLDLLLDEPPPARPQQVVTGGVLVQLTAVTVGLKDKRKWVVAGQQQTQLNRSITGPRRSPHR